MSIQNIENLRAIDQLIINITKCEQQMRNAAKLYRILMQKRAQAVLAGASQATLDQIDAEALFTLRHGSTRPSFAQSRLSRFVTELSTRLGSQANAIAAIDQAISTYSNNSATRQEMVAHLQSLRVHEDAIVNGYLNLGWNLDTVATYLEANIADNDVIYAQPIENTYNQVWQ